MMRRFALLLPFAIAAGACGDDGGGETPVPFPVEYADTYVEVRDCRRSGDHDLHYIRILTDPSGAAAYADRDQPFPEGSVVLKEEYDFGDETCSGEVVLWTVMERLPEGSSPDTLDWVWTEVDAERKVVTVDEPRCIGCHELCTDEVDGYFNTCAVP